MANNGLQEIFIVRMPILTKTREFFAYELKYHNASVDAITSGQAIRKTLDSLIEQFDPIVLSAGKSLLVNLSVQAVLDQAYTSLPNDITILEINAPASGNDEAIASFDSACQQVKSAGYQLSIKGQTAASFEWLPQATSIADLVRVENEHWGYSEALSQLVRTRQPHQQVMASGIDSLDHFDKAKSNGVELFQGEFFFKPQVIRHREIPSFKTNALRLMQEVGKPELKTSELEKIIRQEAALAMSLLRLINSAGLGVRQKIDSIERALLLLGEKRVRRWVMAFAVKDVAGDKSSEIVVECIKRAFFCETIAKLAHYDQDVFDAFMMGILSGLPTLLDMPLLKLLDSLSIGQHIRGGLQRDDSNLGQVYSLFRCYESGNYAKMVAGADTVNITITQLSKAYFEAVSEATEIVDPELAAAA